MLLRYQHSVLYSVNPRKWACLFLVLFCFVLFFSLFFFGGGACAEYFQHVVRRNYCFHSFIIDLTHTYELLLK